MIRRVASNRDAVIILDPLTDWRDVVAAIKKTRFSSIVSYQQSSSFPRNQNAAAADDNDDNTPRPPPVVIAVISNPLSDRQDLHRFIPSSNELKDAGVDFILGENSSDKDKDSSSSSSSFDVYSCAQQIISLCSREKFIICGVIPLGEVAVEYSDILSALLGLKYHNPIQTVLARRDKGIMKDTVSKARLRVSKYCRIYHPSELASAITDLSLDYPVVIKTPQGFSTTDVYICNDSNIATQRLVNILQHDRLGPDGRPIVTGALLEEFIDGIEFAVNIIASPSLMKNNKAAVDDDTHVDTAATCVRVTDVWKYSKTIAGGTARYDRADMMNPHDPILKDVVQYAKYVAAAVGIRYGAGHVEVKATFDDKVGRYVDPVMIEVGARLSGGRKAILTRDVVPTWDPFVALVWAHCGLSLTNHVGGDDDDYAVVEFDDDVDIDTIKLDKVLSIVPDSFVPSRCVRHLFLATDVGGTVERIELRRGRCHDGDGVLSLLDTTTTNRLSSLPSYHSHFIMAKQGDMIRPTTDITTYVGFVWLVGSQEDVDRDTQTILDGFHVVFMSSSSS